MFLCISTDTEWKEMLTLVQKYPQALRSTNFKTLPRLLQSCFLKWPILSVTAISLKIGIKNSPKGYGMWFVGLLVSAGTSVFVSWLLVEASE